MKIRRRTILAVLSMVFVTSFGLTAASAPRPNFLFVLVDDLGWPDVGCYGSTFYETPNVDRLAASGMRFTTAYAACPVCSPTRASIMTGKYPARVGITDWIPGNDPKHRKLLGPRDLHHLPLSEVTIAEALKEAGYRTFFAGKWHLGGKGYYPENQGFDINKGGYEAGAPRGRVRGKYRGAYYVPYRNPKLKDGPPGEYLTDRLADESIKFMEEHVKSHPSTPFFLYLSFYTVHAPIQPCKRYLDTFKEKASKLPPSQGPAYIRERKAWTRQRQDNPAYATMVHAMDYNVGRVLKTLDRLGLTKNTVVIFMSDNGGLSTLPRRGAPTSVLPLRAGKGWCYEGGIREPMIIRAPGVTKAGTVCDVPVTSTDFYPTILQLAGLPLRPRQHADGLSLVGLLKGEKSLNRKALFWHYPHYHGSGWTPGAAVRAGDWKLIEFYEENAVELYNLREDPGERHECGARFPAKRKELTELLHRWRKETGAKMPKPNPAYKGR